MHASRLARLMLPPLACAVLFGCRAEDRDAAERREAGRHSEPIVVRPQVERAEPVAERRPDEQEEREEEPEQPEREQIRFEVSVSERKLYVYRGEERIRTHAVAVGEPDYPTPRGKFRIYQVDWNPDWNPPEGEWAREFEYKAPGDPENPMGRARLIFRPPYTIHGTRDLGSLGKAASHGSIRVANDVAMALARLVMEHGGASRPESWYEEARANPKEMRSVALPKPVPLTIRD